MFFGSVAGFLRSDEVKESDILFGEVRYSRQIRLLLTACLALGTSACSGGKFFLMPAPEVYDAKGFNPLANAKPIQDLPYQGVLYATDRQPAGPKDKERFYLNDRGDFLRLGVARVDLSTGKEMSWDEARRISLLKNRSHKYPLAVSSVEEFGSLERSLGFFSELADLGDNPQTGEQRYAQAINAQMAKSKRKHIYIYVHGYKTVFENPTLVATELWHFMGYDGAFIAYSWPATPSRWAYLKDIETAAGYARNLRLFLEFLSEKTDAERIHIVGYSAGTRLVARALEQLALKHEGRSHKEVRDTLRLGNVILLASDIDRNVFVNYLSDGLLNIPEHLSIYISGNDAALGIARFLTRRERLGQLLKDHRSDKRLLEVAPYMSLIDVTDAEGSRRGNGHGYFRSSPWVSSDILMEMMHDLAPEQRGLVLNSGEAIWTFPPDYIERLRKVLNKLHPGLATPQGK
jgi:esterase/lipase superfamily enzyme